MRARAAREVEVGLPPPGVIRVLVIADVRLHRDGVAALLRGDGRLGVLATAGASDELESNGLAADVVVLDAAAEDGFEFIRRWSAAGGRPVVVMGIPGAEEHLVALAEAGVLGFVEREATVDELVASIESVARGEASCPPRVATTLLRRITLLTATPVAAVDSSALTVRERQVVALIAEGLSNKEIAQRLYIEMATAKNHVHNILEKLEVSSRGQVAARMRFVEGKNGSRIASLPGSDLCTRAG
jgi:two-component system, NarL family, nitrate/nitrite response regulator NarL